MSGKWLIFMENRDLQILKKILKKTPLNEEAKERRAYIRSHKFSVEVDQATQRCKLNVTEKDCK